MEHVGHEHKGKMMDTLVDIADITNEAWYIVFDISNFS